MIFCLENLIQGIESQKEKHPAGKIIRIFKSIELINILSLNPGFLLGVLSKEAIEINELLEGITRRKDDFC